MQPPTPLEVVCTAYKATCIRQSLGKSVSSEWKAAINADIERIGTIVWLGSRAFLHYLTTSVATGKTTLPCDDNGLNRLIKACFTVHCDGTVEVASLPDKTPAFVEWRHVWETQVAPHLPKVARVSIKGLGNALSLRDEGVPHCVQEPPQVWAHRPLRPYVASGRRTLKAGGRDDSRSTSCRIAVL